MKGACEQCTHLWRVYGLATVNHRRLEEQQQVAAKRGDTARVQALEAELQAALREREKARTELYEHETSQHSRSRPANG